MTQATQEYIEVSKRPGFDLDEDMLPALDASIQHWRDNLSKAITGTLQRSHMRSDQCALCELYRASDDDDAVNCRACPLSGYGAECELPRSPWHTAATRTDVPSVRHMLKTLVAVRSDVAKRLAQ